MAETREPLSEAELALLWEGQRFPPAALRTPDGRRVRVLHPGRRGGGAGPDFLDAAVVVDGRRRRGDVELHVRASAFRAHGHDSDPAYARLALHVVFRADDGLETPLWGGGRAPVAALAPWLERRRAELKSWLKAPPSWQEPCRTAQERLGAAAVGAALREAGERRFQIKAERMAAAAASLGGAEAVWRALFDVLGVGGERAGFRRLAALLPVQAARSLLPPTRLEAVLLSLAGLGLPPAGVAGLPSPLSPPLDAKGGGRPANRPRRRLAAVAHLLARAKGDPAAYALESVREAAAAPQLVAAWQVGGGAGEAALLGPERARELVFNVVLPWAAAQPALRERALSLLRCLPAGPAYGRTRFLEANLGGEVAAGRGGTLVRQGLLAYVEQWCSRGGCGRCPLS